MRWSTGWYGAGRHDRLPRNRKPVLGLDAVWTVDWPTDHVRSAGSGPLALAVIGDCGADGQQLHHALRTVRARDWTALTCWPGSYLTIARSGESLVVIGDLAGQHPVYWRAEGTGTWWSTSAGALAALDGAPYDLAYAVRTAAAVPDLTHHTVPGCDKTVYYSGLDDLSTLPLTDTPHAYAVTACIKRAVLEAVAQHQPAAVHFTGAAGDAVLSAPSSYLSDLLRDRQHRRALAHAHAHARLRRVSPLTVLRRARPASRTGLADAWRNTATELRQAPRAWVPQAERPIAWTPLLATADWMSPEVRHQLAEALDAASSELPEEPRHLAAWTDRQDLARVGADTSGLGELARADHGIEIAAPFLDNEVIRACLAVPAEQRGAPGRYKPLLGEAFAHTGVLPDFVLTRLTKGGFNALAYAGLTRHTAVLACLLGPSSRLSASGLITQPPVERMLRRAAAGQATAQGALHLAVSAEVWLRQMETTTAASWWEVVGHVASA